MATLNNDIPAEGIQHPWFYEVIETGAIERFRTG